MNDESIYCRQYRNIKKTNTEYGKKKRENEQKGTKGIDQ